MNLSIFSSKPHLNDAEKLVFIDSLATMLRAGIPILEAIDSIGEDASGKAAKRIVKKISADVSSGKALSEGLAAFPESFDPVFINVVKSGEAAGNLDKVLSDSASSLKTNIETVNSIKSAMFYPALVILVLLVVSFYSFAFALPKVATIFFELKLKLPAYSQFILRSSLFIGKYKLFFGAGIALTVIVVLRAFKIRVVRSLVLSSLTKIPTVANLVRLMDLARFTSTSALLLKAGVPIIECLEISKNVVISRTLAGDIDFVRDEITQGSSLEVAMKKRPASFPALLRRVVKVGEESGNLDQSLLDISDHYGKKFADIIKNLTVIIEPILIIFIAVVVAVILLSVITPLYQGIGSLNQR